MLLYFELLPFVKNLPAKQRASVDKEVGDYIKLASWKDRDAHALMQSTQKTHRVLHKGAQKFRAIIRQPVSTKVFATDKPQETISPSTSTVPPVVHREATSL
jgi:midasin (ATPase involved in ribosome maturation)